MNDILKLGENLFKPEMVEEVDKQKTFARLVEIDGEVYFNTQFKLKTIDEGSIPSDEKEYHKKLIPTDNSILVDNAYTSGNVEVSLINGTTHEIKIVLQIAAKKPPFGAD
ncbi:hypothetical protein [Reichenbachiella sp.]